MLPESGVPSPKRVSPQATPDALPKRNAALLSFIAALEAIGAWTGRVVSWFSLWMVLLSFLVVVLRYAFDLGWIAMQESVTYLHAALFMLGAAYTLRRNGHVRVDIFYQKLSRRGRAWVDLLGTLLLLTPVCVFIAWSGWGYVWESWAVLEGSREAGGIPGVYLLKTLIIVMPVLMLLQGLAWMLRSGLFLAGVGDALPAEEGVATGDTQRGPETDRPVQRRSAVERERIGTSPCSDSPAAKPRDGLLRPPPKANGDV
ncbi:MAG: TRAP transporter small permease subunit [Candidatus Thiosymbion ectosymbiont of Robbea hypermnestra]|nr:TRAP transporter small permease subunit [Candidatus Thiosymbion ectosymbiont of Robbea hypermnestra]